ncbi:MAG: calcium/sodium antiporter [Hahellaceae bacterium]|nr:calcium/sodium antiporter [Hahellaceae bacterium]MCP5211222.1 calcium/sodium antiporter [Hahellaceae bacterium]
MELFYFFAAIAVGLALLIWSADEFVTSSVSIARQFKISPMIIGLTIVAFGTSAPEMVVSATAAFEGATGLAVGNALGSNIANIGLVLGITALIAPLPIKPLVIRRELPILLATSAAAYLVLYDLELSILDGVFLLALMAIAMYLLLKSNPGAAEIDAEIADIPQESQTKAIIMFVLSLAVLIVSSKSLVYGATGLAKYWQVSDLVIGVTIVAIGTSLPELAASVASALKGHHDIALGNVIGSNLFNLLTVLPMPALIHPSVLEASVVNRDYLSMMVLTLLLTAFAFLMRKRGVISRAEGGIFLTCYILYLGWVYQSITA